jgi:hypothetical protein
MKGKIPGLIYVIQPPLVQLNGPYPAPYYLKAFLDARGYRTRVLDHSIGLFERIFCKTGLKKIFADARRIYENRGRPAEAGEYTPDLSIPYVLYRTERFLSEEDRWLSTVGRLVGFCGAGTGAASSPWQTGSSPEGPGLTPAWNPWGATPAGRRPPPGKRAPGGSGGLYRLRLGPLLRP